MKTRAVIQNEVGGPLTVDEIEIPEMDANQVLIKLFASGICHSQLHQMYNPAWKRPLLLGHEATGSVVAKGANVVHVKEGDHVMITWVPRNGYEGMEIPTQGRVVYGGREANWQAAFTWAEDTVAHEQYVVKMPNDVATDVTSIIGCAVMTGAGAAMNTVRVGKGEAVAVYGVGGVGLCIVQTCANLGASPIIAVDLSDEKLKFAKQFGANIGINAACEDPVKKIIEITNGGAHFAFDAIGAKKTMEQILPSVRQGIVAVREGGTAILVGVPKTPATFNMRDLFLARTYKGSFAGSSLPERDFPIFIQWFKEGRLPLNKMVSKRYKMDQINEACEALSRGEINGRSIMEF